MYLLFSAYARTPHDAFVSYKGAGGHASLIAATNLSSAAVGCRFGVFLGTSGRAAARRASGVSSSDSPIAGSRTLFTDAGFNPATARHAFQKITYELFGKKWRPHEMRHSAASLFLAQAVPLRTISDILGHSSIQITSDVYAHMATTAHPDVLNRLSSSITEAQ